MPVLKPVVVTTTAPDEAMAETLARALIDAKLAACVQIEPIHSFYPWNGEICSSTEIRLTIKTARCHYAKIERLIVQLHPYECPQILMQPISRGFTPYLRWIKQNLGI